MKRNFFIINFRPRRLSSKPWQILGKGYKKNTSKWHIKWTSISQSFINASSFDSCLYWMAAQNLCCNLQRLCPKFVVSLKIFSKKAPSYNQTLEQVQGNKNDQIWKFKAVVTKNVQNLIYKITLLAHQFMTSLSSCQR